VAGILYLLHVFRNTYSACRSFSILGVQNEADLDRTLGGKNRSGSFIIDRKQGLVTGSNSTRSKTRKLEHAQIKA